MWALRFAEIAGAWVGDGVGIAVGDAVGRSVGEAGGEIGVKVAVEVGIESESAGRVEDTCWFALGAQATRKIARKMRVGAIAVLKLILFFNFTNR